MNYSKALRTFTVIILIGIVTLWACGANQSSAPAENDPSPEVQTKAADDEQPESLSEEDTETASEGLVATSEGPPPVATKETGPVRILVADEVTTLDPYQMVSIHPDGSVASHLWDTLTLLDHDLQVKPHLAQSWRLVNDLTWEFELHPDLNFHNGEPINAEAVRFSIERARSMPGSLETFAQDVNLEKVEIVDDYTLRLVTEEPVVNLPFHFAFLEIVPPLYYTETDPDQLATAPIGSGPYQLNQAWSSGEALVLEAVSGYWEGSPVYSQLVFETITLPEERLAALRQGAVDLVTDLPPMPVEQWDSPGSRLVAIESTQRMFIGINFEPDEPLADKRVRQALNYGLNVDQIVEDWLDGYGTPYGSWVNPPANNPELTPWPYDPDLARQLLAEAGYSEGFTTTLRTPVGVYDNDVQIGQAIAQQLGQIGVTVNVETIGNWGVYKHNLVSGNSAPLFLLGLNSRGDGLEDAKNLSGDFEFNPIGWRNESFEAALARAAGDFTDNSRARFLNEVQSIAYDEAPWLWLWRSHYFYGVSQELEWTPRPDGLIYLYEPVSAPAEEIQ